MGRSTSWFLTAYFLCALTAWSNMLPVPSEPDLILSINLPKEKSFTGWGEVDWARVDFRALKDQPYGALQQFVNLIHPPGAVLLGVLFDRIGARRCYVLSLLSGVVQHTIRSGAGSLWHLYASKLPLVFRHTYLVTRTLIMQETSEEGRTRALAHASLAHSLGSMLGIGAGADAMKARDYHGVALAAALLSLVALAVSFCLTRPEAPEKGAEAGGPLAAVLGRAASPPPAASPVAASRPHTLLPAPVAMLAWPTSRKGLAKLLSQPVVYLLVAAKMGDAVASGVQDRGLRRFQEVELKSALGFDPNLEEGTTFWRFVATLCLIGPCTRKFTPRSFILVCMGCQCFVSLGLAAVFCGFSTLSGLLPAAVLHQLLKAAVNVHTMASAACDLVLTTLLASAIVREERGTIIGLDNFFFLLPPLASPGLAAVVYAAGGVSGAYGMSFVLYLVIWLMIRKFILPRYHEKAG